MEWSLVQIPQLILVEDVIVKMAHGGKSKLMSGTLDTW